MIRLLKSLTYLCLFFATAVWAIKAEVELLIDTQQSFFVSQKIPASLVIKTDAFAIQALQVDTRGNDDVIIIAPESAAYKSTENEAGTQWQKTVYHYTLYPMRSGELRLEPFKLQFSASMGYGQPQQQFNLATRDFVLIVKQPAGASGDRFVLSTKKLTLSVTYQPDSERLKVGEAISRTISITAVDVPDLLLPPVPDSELKRNTATAAAFKVYPEEPLLSESDKDNSLIASRVETHTFVANHESVATIAEIRIPWFNPETQEHHNAIIPAKEITIVANPLLKDNNAANTSQGSQLIAHQEPVLYSYGWLLLVIMSIVSLLYWKKISKQQSDPEKSAFKALEQALLTGDSTSIYHYFYQWIRIIVNNKSPLNFKTITPLYPQLKPFLEALEVALVQTPDVQMTLDTRAFLHQIRLIHQTFQVEAKELNNQQNELLKTINPY